MQTANERLSPAVSSSNSLSESAGAPTDLSSVVLRMEGERDEGSSHYF